MNHDDEHVGRILTRREALTALGVAGASLLAGCAREGTSREVQRGALLPECVVRPQQTAGPYFVDEKLRRSDIRSDPAGGSIREGVPLELSFQVSRVGAAECAPLQGVLVDVWQCDALGVYSGVRDFNRRFDTTGQQFLRGYQVTDADGAARFLTIYPGWYPGRTVHIHFKLRTQGSGGRGYEFTSQLYFDDASSDRVFRREPYVRQGERSIRNQQDGIYRRGGEQLMLALAETDQGFAGSFAIGLQLP
jgi:protocatechuate 3,4-dioxygenase beta subunit